MKSVSVIIPHYNRSKIVKKAICSALHQKVEHIEVIVIDDCSDQLNRKELEQVELEINDPRLIVIYLDKNVGGGQARNIGIKRSSSDYIAFLDSDDVWANNKIDEISKVVELGKSNAIYYSQVKRISHSGKETLYPTVGKNDTSVGEYLFCNNGLIQTSTIVIDAKTAKKIMFNPDLPRHQDYDFVLRAEKYGCKFIFLKKPLAFWIEQNEGGVLKKGGSVEFFEKWISDYSCYLTVFAKSNYLLTVLLPLYSYQGSYKKSFKLIIGNIMNVTPANRRIVCREIFKLCLRPLKRFLVHAKN